MSMAWTNRKLSPARELARLFKSKLLELALMGHRPSLLGGWSPSKV